jgi:hypothetical protein
MATVDVIANRSTASEILGKAYFETDTNSFIVYNGIGWVELQSDGTGAAPFQNNNSLSFDGVDDMVAVGNITALNSASTYSLSWWENDTNTNVNAETYRFGGGVATFGLSFYGTNGYFNTGAGTNGYTSYRPSQNAWHHIVVTFESSTVKIYVDGDSTPKTTIATANSSTASNAGDGFRIGARGNNSKYYLGLMDEYAIFGEALSTGQIANIYNAGTPGDLSSFVGAGNGDLKHLYRFEQDATDSQGSNNGTLTGTTYSNNLPA